MVNAGAAGARPFRIVIVGPFFWPQREGVEKVMLSHARHLVARGHEVHVVTSFLQFPRGAFEGLPAEETHEGIRIHRLKVLVRKPHWRFSYLSNGGLIIPGLSRLLADLDADIYHAHQIAAPAWAHAAAWVAWRKGRKFFYSPHWHPSEGDETAFSASIVRALNRLPLATARRIFHLTSRDFAGFAAEFPRADRSRFVVLHNGVEPARPLPPRAPDGRFEILFVGRVDSPIKGFDLLRAAFAAARRENWRLTVIGRISAETKASLEAEFGTAVRVLGPVAEERLEQAYAGADLFVMPSRYEGFGMPYIEAMRYGCAVVGTAVGGVPEVVPEGTGILVPPEDVPALASALTTLADDAALRARLGEAGRGWAQRFLWPAIIDRLEEAYRTA